MERIRFDFNNMLSANVGKRHGVAKDDLEKAFAGAEKAFGHFQRLIADVHNRTSLNLEWVRLPFKSRVMIDQVQRLGDEIASRYENVISLGIGGSYLGIKAAQDALCSPYHNEFASLRGKRPRIYFEGNNLDPDTIGALLGELDPKKTFVIVISKSGETTETKSAFAVTKSWLKKGVGKRFGRHVFAITDLRAGALRREVSEEHAKDPLGFYSLPLAKGVGGRYSELNIGLIHLAVMGVSVRHLLGGAQAMAARCVSKDLFENPALMYAVLNNILYRKKGKTIAVLMPFSETLKSTAEWYSQLLAESLGKKYHRRILRTADGSEFWLRDRSRIANVGRTPVPSRGTSDLHSIHQNNVEGENNKTVTFIKVKKFRRDIKVPAGNGFLSGVSYSKLLSLAGEATEWSLSSESRPNCAITMPEISPYYWGGLIYFFEMATAFEGELLNVNAFDQPGVEGYKHYMYYKLRKPGVSRALHKEIQKHPLAKDKKFVL
ncbi:MAG: hypothetical protein JW919_06640 [Candidatus Omnitrophica bacterium]|nr:hypothetical protein [Candidatus Omnitrophota bacterium]